MHAVQLERWDCQHQHRLAAVLCGLMSAANVVATEHQVFSDRHHPVEAPSDVRVVELDAPARLEADLGANLPADPVQAAARVQQRLQDGGVDLQRRAENAYQGVVDAWRLGITQIPAVVVDRRYVVYGEHDVTRALDRIEAYKRTRP